MTMMGTHGVGLLLISAAAGYWVLTQAAGQKNQMKKIGNFVGLIIIVVSLLGTACKIYYQVTGATGKGYLCPFTGKAAPSAPSTTQK